MVFICLAIYSLRFYATGEHINADDSINGLVLGIMIFVWCLPFVELFRIWFIYFRLVDDKFPEMYE